MKKNYLLFLDANNPHFYSEVYFFCHTNRIRVLAGFQNEAIEVYATPDEISILQNNFLFNEMYEGRIEKTILDALPSSTRLIADAWNLSKEGGSSQQDVNDERDNKSWADTDSSEPTPVSNISLDYFLATLQKNGIYPTTQPPFRLQYDQRSALARYKVLESRLKQITDDDTKIYHLTRFALLYPSLESTVLQLTPKIINELFNAKNNQRFLLNTGLLAPDEPACWKMNGNNSVALIFVESSKPGEPKFNTSNNEIARIYQQTADGLRWLARENVHGDLNWQFFIQLIAIDRDGRPEDVDEDYWWVPAMAAVRFGGESYPGNNRGLASFRRDLREFNKSDHAIALFITPFLSSPGSFATPQYGKVIIAGRKNWQSPVFNPLTPRIMHEVSHLYGAADEYGEGEGGTPCSSCFSLHGCDRVPNGNCRGCAVFPASCFMQGPYMNMCSYTRKQVGWLPALSFHPNILFFGVVNRGDARVMSFTIRNQTGNTARFSFDTNPPGPIQWDAFDGELANGESIAFDVTFRPIVSAPVSRTLKLNTSVPGGPHFISMSGKGEGGI